MYIENLLKKLLQSNTTCNGNMAIDIYVAEDVVELLQNRLDMQRQKMNNINFIAVANRNFYVRMFDLYKKTLFVQYDLIFLPNPMPLFVSRAKRLGLVHDVTFKQTPELFSRFFYRYSGFLIDWMNRFDEAIGYISKTTQEDLHHFFGIDEKYKKMIYLPNGIPFKVQNYTRPPLEKVYQKYQSRDLEFIVVGRINRAKGFDRILKFLAYFDHYLKNENSFSKVVLHIVGKQTDETKALFEHLSLESIELIFHGFTDDEKLSQLFLQSHFCFFLSRNEGYGLPLVEAMWMRVIPIVSNIAIFTEIMGETYPKFDDQSGYEKAIKDFIVAHYQDQDTLRNSYEQLESVVEKEKNGYAVAARNLIAYIENER